MDTHNIQFYEELIKNNLCLSPFGIENYEA